MIDGFDVILVGRRVGRLASGAVRRLQARAQSRGVVMLTVGVPALGSDLRMTADTSWVLLGLKAFVAAVVGGIGNVRGAVAGALLIAFVEMFGAAYFSPHMRDLYVFVILIVVLLVRPTGLFGKAVVEKV